MFDWLGNNVEKKITVNVLHCRLLVCNQQVDVIQETSPTVVIWLQYFHCSVAVMNKIAQSERTVLISVQLFM